MDNLPATIKTAMPIEKALGYYLAANIKAERDHPPFDRITHDGIAINYKSLSQKKFEIESYAAAGQERGKLKNKTRCIEVATGAPLPEGTDTVIPYELISKQKGSATLKSSDFKIGNCLHKQGSDARKNTILLETGSKIGITEITILAANGVTDVPIYQKPKIGILATGDELVAISDKILPHQIRRSNDIMLQSALKLNGFDNLEAKWLPDDHKKISKQLQNWLAAKDVIITIGGVSKGTYDYVPGILENLDVTKIFHQVAQRPGKPLWFGKYNKALIFGLPGNPASSLTCLTRYVIPALSRMSGALEDKQRKMTLTDRITPHELLTLFIPVKLESGKAKPVQTQGSGDFTSLQSSRGFVEIPPSYISGDKVVYCPWVKL